MPVWPSTLPAVPLVDRYRETAPDTVLRSEMEQGPAKTRPRTTAGVRLFRLSYMLSRAEVTTLDTFYRATLSQGALTFSFPHPRTAVVGPYRFRAPPEFTAVNGEYFRADLELEAMP